MLEFNFTPFPALVTERLLLRKIVPGDLDDLFRLRTNDVVMTYLDRPKQTLDEIRELIEKTATSAENNEAIAWAITLRERPGVIGDISFWRTIREHHRAEIGYSLHPDSWRQGIASEAMRAVLNYGFQTMQLHSVEANVNPENIASFRLLEKFGFVREAYFRENYHHAGRFLDSAIYSLLHYNFKP
ncbi:MAG: GNAT family N-acetyltransferase [Bacteroidetes bacterium]|nr:GNAT family N-acetyltransferase [Bacteroidota bacterium]